MEEKVFRTPAVAGVLDGYVEARLHTDGKKNIERILELQKELTGSVATPIYVVIDPKGEQVRHTFEGATFDAGVFLEFLQEGLERL
jgi:hypothetical protein